jgi:hypothetical protein
MYTYWKFYWPLALTGVGMVLSLQFQNATLAQYPEAVTELAILALAYGVFGIFNAGMQFIAQLANVYARSPAATKRSWLFVLVVSCCIMLPLALLAFTGTGRELVGHIFNVEATIVGQVAHYLALLCPLIILNGQRHYFSGLMIQSRLTGWMTIFNFIYLTVVIAGLIIGFSLGGKPVYVVVGAETVGVSIFIALLFFACRRLYQAPEKLEHENITYTELLRFFIPVSTTGVMFALSRPILFAFVARAPDGLLAIAALRVAFDFSMVFQQAANQFRHFFITFGFDDIERKKRFMILITIGLTAIMLIFATTPLSTLLWSNIVGLPDGLVAIARDASLIMCFMPAIIIYRNYYHGRLMVNRQTGGMAYGSILRVVGIYLAAQSLFSFDLLNHITATFILIFGFVIEAVIARRASIYIMTTLKH